MSGNEVVIEFFRWVGAVVFFSVAAWGVLTLGLNALAERRRRRGGRG